MSDEFMRQIYSAAEKEVLRPWAQLEKQRYGRNAEFTRLNIKVDKATKGYYSALLSSAFPTAKEAMEATDSFLRECGWEVQDGPIEKV
jgi:hypothetical protein